MTGVAEGTRVRLPLLLLALAYTLFVVYGSLVPLEFRPLSWDTAVARFGAMPFLKLGIGSRADWMANLLLFIPLTFVWMGVLSPSGTLLGRLAATLVLIPLATALSLGIEFVQLFFPQRTVSQNDVFAETLGGVLGVALWWVAGARFSAWLQGWRAQHSRAALAERIAWTYFAGVLVYNVLPLDLTISAVEIFHKWQDGRVNLIPFARLPADPFYAVYEIATDALLWVPLALLWRLDGKRGPWRAWGMTLVTAATLEVLQLFVFSRVSDITDLFTAAAGAALGTGIGSRVRGRGAHAEGLTRDRGTSWAMRRWAPFVLTALWMAALALVFWFPFDFRTDGAFVRTRLDFVLRVPFEVYYFGTEYRAITEVLRKTLFFAPLGALLAWGVAVQPWRLRAPLFVLALLLLAAVPAVIEFGQVMLPHKIADTTDWFLAWAGGLAGYALARRFARAPRVVAAPHVSRGEEAHTNPASQPVGWHFVFSTAGLALLLWLLGQAAFVPYNVRELLQHDSPVLSALLLAVACYWLAVWPLWLARRRVSALARLLQLPFGLFVYGLVAFLLLRFAVPEESLHDLVGSPILGWGQWETGVRWIALASVPGAMLYLAAQSIRRWRGRTLGAIHFCAVLPVLAIAYWAVVHRAATDNLVELIATPRPLAFAALCGALWLLFFAAASVASPQSASMRFGRPIVVALSLPLAALLVHFGLADEIDKYGQRFSALQFLLSADRQNYAAPAYIWLRYAGVHVLVIAGLAFIQWPHFRTARRTHAQGSDVPY
ncbi:hypothetical protein Tbd_0208 [Thiobacillus denitrificans ATCC 25259]|uniref:VanZ-like domain-containing protein n=1 Tax=Thiobacillus denitrificans (strain ATCC 25259 / T1) TaxID=292415 RepID=Q3SM88_THIDA|nr:VanZ family protein [Thiobacillus denitrificans]AAZ96161.1 hypothetical protein Tbd_0208 [Thiobacillus denitrificans ATCC 25259]